MYFVSGGGVEKHLHNDGCRGERALGFLTDGHTSATVRFNIIFSLLGEKLKKTLTVLFWSTV